MKPEQRTPSSNLGNWRNGTSLQRWASLVAARMALGVAVACGCVSACATPAPAPTIVSGAIQVEPGVSLYYQRYGAGAETIIVPGGFLLAEQFRSLAQPGRSLIFYDMRNRGASSRVEEGGAINIMADVRDLDAVREHIGATRVTLIGYSYLGLMTALYAAEHPDRVTRLVQVGPVPRKWDTPYPAALSAGEETLSEEGRAADEVWRAFAAAAGPDADQRELCRAQARAMSYWLVGDPDRAANVAAPCDHENEWPVNLSRHFEFHFADLQTRDFDLARFARVRIPVLVVHGVIDRNAPYGGGREWARTFPDARLLTIPGGAHNVWLDDDSVLSEIGRFLDGSWPARAERITP